MGKRMKEGEIEDFKQFWFPWQSLHYPESCNSTWGDNSPGAAQSVLDSDVHAK